MACAQLEVELAFDARLRMTPTRIGTLKRLQHGALTLATAGAPSQKRGQFAGMCIRGELLERYLPSHLAHREADLARGKLVECFLPFGQTRSEKATFAGTDGPRVLNRGRRHGRHTKDAGFEHLQAALGVREFVDRLHGRQDRIAPPHDPGIDPGMLKRNLNDSFA